MLLNCMKRIGWKMPVGKVGWPSFSFHYQHNEFDLGNVVNSLDVITKPELSVLDKLRYFKPMNMYYFLDEYSRQLLFYLSEDMALGLGTSIVLVSVAIKLAYGKQIVRAQSMSFEREQMQNQFRKIQLQMNEARNQKDFQALLFHSRKIYELRRENNMSIGSTLATLSQMPILLTWFISLRYICSMPELFPAIKTQGLLWIKDLSTYDPYFIIPVLSAVTSFINISYSPKITFNIPILRPVMHYLRFVPFYGLPFLIFFPAAINMYWFVSALIQLILVFGARSPTVVRALGIKTKQQIHIPQEVFKASIVTTPVTNYKQTVLESQETSTPKTSTQQMPLVHKASVVELTSQKNKTPNDNTMTVQAKAGQKIMKVTLQRPKKSQVTKNKPK